MNRIAKSIQKTNVSAITLFIAIVYLLTYPLSIQSYWVGFLMLLCMLIFGVMALLAYYHNETKPLHARIAYIFFYVVAFVLAIYGTFFASNAKFHSSIIATGIIVAGLGIIYWGILVSLHIKRNKLSWWILSPQQDLFLEWLYVVLLVLSIIHPIK